MWVSGHIWGFFFNMHGHVIATDGGGYGVNCLGGPIEYSDIVMFEDSGQP